MASTKTAPRARKAAPAAPAAEKVKEVGTCLFSGEPTSSKRSRFLPGYDAKLKSVLLQVSRGDAKVSAIPRPAMKILKSGEPLVGFQMNGEDIVIVGNFKARAPKAEKAAAPAPEKVSRRTKSAVVVEVSSKPSRRRKAVVEEESEDEE